MTEKLPLTGKTFAQMQELAPDTIVNPGYDAQDQVTFAEALTLAMVMAKQRVPDEAIKHFEASDRINSSDLFKQASEWNANFGVRGLVDAMNEIVAINMRDTIKRISQGTYSEVKEGQITAAAQVVGYAYLLSLA